MPVAFGVHPDGGNTEAEEAGVVSGEFGFDRGEIGEILVQYFPQLGVLQSGRAAPDHQHAFNGGIDQAFAQHALANHAGGAEQDHFHDLMNASRSALMVAASVVGMPCGKPR